MRNQDQTGRNEGAGHTTVFLALASAIGLLHSLRYTLLPDYEIDDAWISFRIAKNWLTHGELTYNVGLPPVEGMTNLLWTLISASWIGLFPDVDPIGFARMLGQALFLLTIWFGGSLAARLSPEDFKPWAALTAGLLIAVSGSTAFHYVSGLETPLYGFLVVASLLCLHRSMTDGAGWAWGTGVLLGLLAATRPEGVLIGALLAAFSLWNRSTINWKGVVLPLAAAVIAVELFRVIYYGSLIPNTYHAKSPSTLAGIAYLQDYLVWGLGGVGALFFVVAFFIHKKYLRFMAAIAVLMTAAVVLSGGDWMAGFRRFIPSTLMWSILAPATVFSLAPRVRRPLFLLLAAAGLIVLSGTILGKDHSKYATRTLGELGWLAHGSPQINSVALNDIGRFGYFFEKEVFDIAGLTDQHIAHQEGGHMQKVWDEDYFRSRSPDMILLLNGGRLTASLKESLVLVPSAAPVLSSILRNGGYQFHTQVPTYKEDLYALIFVRENIELDPKTWGEASPSPFRGLMRDRVREVR